jgi:hypothetical protein
MIDLASIYLRFRQWEEAEELNLYVVRTNEKVLGNEHLD